MLSYPEDNLILLENKVVLKEITRPVSQFIHNTLCFHFTIPFTQLNAAANALYQANKEQFSVPGMRKGKASRQLIESHYGKTIFSARVQIEPESSRATTIPPQ